MAFFQDNTFRWNWSKTLTVRSDVAVRRLNAAKESDPHPVRIQRKKTNDVIVASLIANPYHDSATLFVQLLPIEVGNQLSAVERRIQLEDYLFKDDDEFRMQLQGVFGAFRPKCKNWSLNVAFAEFFRPKGDRWDGQRRTRLHSDKGREYVRLRLSEWTS